MLHASSLNDYIKNNMIPRGLRFQKGPAMFQDNDTFFSKWKAILNKCSMDLILLFMEQCMSIVESNTVEIEEIKSKLQNDVDTDLVNVKMKKIQDEIDLFEKKHGV